MYVRNSNNGTLGTGLKVYEARSGVGSRAMKRLLIFFAVLCLAVDAMAMQIFVRTLTGSVEELCYKVIGAASLERKHKYRTYRPTHPQSLNPVNPVNDVSKTKT